MGREEKSREACSTARLVGKFGVKLVPQTNWRFAFPGSNRRRLVDVHIDCQRYIRGLGILSRRCGTVAWSSAVGQSYLGSSTSCFPIDAAEKSHPSTPNQTVRTFLSLSYNSAMKKTDAEYRHYEFRKKRVQAQNSLTHSHRRSSRWPISCAFLLQFSSF